MIVLAAQVWPKDALEAVAYKFLKEMDLDDPTRAKLVELCQSVHRKVSSFDLKVGLQWLYCCCLKASFSLTKLKSIVLAC